MHLFTVHALITSLALTTVYSVAMSHYSATVHVVTVFFEDC